MAVESLPDFDGFLAQWRTLVEERVAGAKQSDWERREDRWLREVVARTQGPNRLAARWLGVGGALSSKPRGIPSDSQEP